MAATPAVHKENIPVRGLYCFCHRLGLTGRPVVKNLPIQVGQSGLSLEILKRAADRPVVAGQFSQEKRFAGNILKAILDGGSYSGLFYRSTHNRILDDMGWGVNGPNGPV